MSRVRIPSLAPVISHKVNASQLFQLPEDLPFGNCFLPDAAPWVWVARIAEALESFDFRSQHGKPRDLPAGVFVGARVFLHPSVRLPPYCVLQGPAYIGAGSEIRPGAFIRENVIAGRNCVLGNSCEYKNCLLLEAVESAHFNYIGDSVLGRGAHLGAGSILANLRFNKGPVDAHTDKGRVPTGLRKLGAMIGEEAQVGCNAVLQPGTIIGKNGNVMPGSSYGGYLPEGTVAPVRAPPGD